jgi:hypothetical protein
VFQQLKVTFVQLFQRMAHWDVNQQVVSCPALVSVLILMAFGLAWTFVPDGAMGEVPCGKLTSVLFQMS